MRRFLFAAIMAVTTVLSGASMAAATSIDTGPTGTQHSGWSTPAWDSNGGPAFTNSAVTTDMQAIGSKVVRYQALDCPTTIVNACGTDNHTGSLTASTVQGVINGITGTFGSIPFLQLPPTSKGAIGPLADGTVMCPPTSNFGMNLASDKELVRFISQVYTGPMYVEQANEPEYNCAAKWGVSAGTAAFGTDNAKMYDATVPPLVKYMRTLGFTSIGTVAYMGEDIGTSHGWNCTASSGYGGFTCTANNTVKNAFNNQLHTTFVANASDTDYRPNAESLHSYCHSADNATAPGSGSPYSFSDGLCQSLYRQDAKTFHTRMSAIWGTTNGPQIKLADSEWEPGVCTSSSCWSGWSTPTTVTSAVTGFQATLKDSGLSSNGYDLSLLFGIPGGNACATPGGNYDLVEVCSGTATLGPAYNGWQQAVTTMP